MTTLETTPPFDVYSADCPTRAILDRLGSKWTGLVLVILAERPHHFGELRRRIPGSSKRMLVQTLRMLERDGLLTRTVIETTNPPMVRYALTQLGRTLVVPLHAIHEWAEANIAQILAARESHDLAGAGTASEARGSRERRLGHRQRGDDECDAVALLRGGTELPGEPVDAPDAQ